MSEDPGSAIQKKDARRGSLLFATLFRASKRNEKHLVIMPQLNEFSLRAQKTLSTLSAQLLKQELLFAI